MVVQQKGLVKVSANLPKEAVEKITAIAAHAGLTIEDFVTRAAADRLSLVLTSISGAESVPLAAAPSNPGPKPEEKAKSSVKPSSKKAEPAKKPASKPSRDDSEDEDDEDEDDEDDESVKAKGKSKPSKGKAKK